MISGPILNNAKESEKFETEFQEPPVYGLEEMISAIEEMLVNSIAKSLPRLNCKKCGYDSCLDLAQAVLRGEAAIKDCEVQETNITNVIVDGKNIPIGKFPQQIIRKVTLGIIESLKGIKKHPHNVKITVKANQETTADK
jgi:molybdopterin-guanine dinucleotide biosynthesis protein B